MKITVLGLLCFAKFALEDGFGWRLWIKGTVGMMFILTAPNHWHNVHWIALLKGVAKTPAAERARQAWKDQLTKNAEKVARKLQKMAATERAAKRKFIRDGDGRDKASKVKARKETKIGKSNPFVHFSSALLLHVWPLQEITFSF
jgi:hypothetical protein